MKTKLNIDSLNECLHDIATDSMRSHNPVLILDTDTGNFSIQSGLHDFKDSEKIIVENLDNDGIPGWTDDFSPTGIYIENKTDMKFFQGQTMDWMDGTFDA